MIMTEFSFWLNNFFKQTQHIWGIPCFSSHAGWHRMHPLQPASHAAVPAAPSQNQRESEWDLKEKCKREVALSLPELSEIKPSQESFSLSLSLFLWIHTSRFTRRIALAVMATLLPHSRLCYYDCEVLTEFDSGLHISFNMWWCEIDSYTFYSLTALWTLFPPFSTLFSLFCFWLHFCLFRRQLFVGCALYYCADCLHVFSFVSGCCLFCSVLCSWVRKTVWVYFQAQ